MEDARTQARHCLQRFTSAWLEGDRAGVADTCQPTVLWWSPLAPENLSGADAVGAHLEVLLRDVARPVEITALIVNGDGTRGVVEMLSSGADGRQPTALTSIVGLSGAKVADGRTYVETQAHSTLDSASA
jgi:hypothetical protein